MKKYMNIYFIFPLVLLATSILSFFNYLQTECTSGRWGYGSCGNEALVLPSAMLVVSSICLTIFFRASKTTKNKKMKEERKF